MPLTRFWRVASAGGKTVARLIHLDGKETEHSGPFSIEQAQKLVGGHVAVVTSRKASHGVVILCDEDAGPKGTPMNLYATTEFGMGLLGGVLVCTSRKDWKGWAR